MEHVCDTVWNLPVNYQLHYDRLINRARNRIVEGYKEQHHIKPKCLGGDNSKSNLVYLTPEEHYVAHQLLTKLHLNVPGVMYGAVMLSFSNEYHIRNNKLFGWLRRRYSVAQKTKPRTPEWCARISAGRTGAGSSLKGKHLEDSWRQNISLGKLGQPKSEAHKAAIAASWQITKENRRAALKAAWARRRQGVI